jgi:hypothetical protein
VPPVGGYECPRSAGKAAGAKNSRTRQWRMRPALISSESGVSYTWFQNRRFR